jgi:hypothetical protein
VVVVVAAVAVVVLDLKTRAEAAETQDHVLTRIL